MYSLNVFYSLENYNVRFKERMCEIHDSTTVICNFGEFY